MAYYPVTEAPDGELMVTIDGEHKYLRAHRALPHRRAITLEGTLIRDGSLAGYLYVDGIEYRWPDGSTHWGESLGKIYALYDTPLAE
jgi:hypothetical protein